MSAFLATLESDTMFTAFVGVALLMLILICFWLDHTERREAYGDPLEDETVTRAKEQLERWRKTYESTDRPTP